MSWWHYLLLVNFYLVLFFVFYALLLSKETFFHLNRIYLVAASLLSFFIPLIQSSWVKGLFITQQVQYTIFNNRVLLYTFKPVENYVTLGNVFTALYITVAIVLTLRLLWQLVVLKRAIENPHQSSAYSFFKKVSLGNNLPDRDIIAEHEQVHASQWHSVDVLIVEAVMIINWFNPVVYLYRFAIKYIHEFIADRQVLEAGTDKADYALLLLSQTFETPTNGLVSNFYNSSLLKQRIFMLQKDRSKRIVLAKYGLSAPLFILMLIFSSATVNNSKALSTINNGAANVFQTPATNSIKLITGTSDETLSEKLKQVKAAALTDEINTHEDSEEYMQGVNSNQLQAVANNFLTIENTNVAKPIVFHPIERQPEFPGGMDKFYEILRTNIHYPDDMRQNRIEGKVIVQFVIEKDGSLTEFKTLRAPGYGSEEEALRALHLLPKWNPGYQNGQAVSVKYIVPIDFKLEVNPNLKDTTTTRSINKNDNTMYVVSADDIKKGMIKKGAFNLTLFKPQNLALIKY